MILISESRARVIKSGVHLGNACLERTIEPAIGDLGVAEVTTRDLDRERVAAERSQSIDPHFPNEPLIR